MARGEAGPELRLLMEAASSRPALLCLVSPSGAPELLRDRLRGARPAAPAQAVAPSLGPALPATVAGETADFEIAPAEERRLAVADEAAGAAAGALWCAAAQALAAFCSALSRWMLRLSSSRAPIASE